MADLSEQDDMTKRTCSVEGCEKPHSGRGYCAAHYQKWHRYGDPLVAVDRSRGSCQFPGCDKPHDSRGHCGAHARQIRLGVELRPLRSYGGGPCSVNGCSTALVAHGLCGKHLQRFHKHGDVDRVDQGREGSRKYELNESFFDEVTTEVQAYWLGFVTADGCIINSGRTNALRVDLSDRDTEHLELMRQHLGSTKPLSFSRTFACASFDSWRMVESLERLGITPRKSATVEPWDGPAELIPHYWRGMFDGDGSIGRVKRDDTWFLTLSGSEACTRGFGEWARSVCGATAVPRKAGGCWSWTVMGARKAQSLATALYDNANLSLSRKQVLADELMATDFDALNAASELRRRESIRLAWATGRHPRSKAH